MDYQPEKEYDSKLYFGYEPVWGDILSEWDFFHPMTENILNDIKSIKKGQLINYFAIYGKAYVGKTCSLMRIAAELYKDGYEVILFNGRQFNINPFLNYIRTNDNNKFVLILDNASYYYYQIKELSKKSLDNKQLIILTTSRPFYHLTRRYYLSDKNFNEYFFESNLDENISMLIIQKLKDKGFLGELQKLKTQEDKIKYFNEKNDLIKLSQNPQKSTFSHICI
jgi:hypothetical protein